MVNLKRITKAAKIKMYKSGKIGIKRAVKKTFKAGLQIYDLANGKDLYNSDVFGNTISSAKEIIGTTRKAVNDTKVYRLLIKN